MSYEVLGESERELEKKIKRIDWNFPQALSSYGLHRLHWYPATFIPQIPAYLIELFSSCGEVIYDPFCGVGTTLVEAVRLGRRAIGTDVNDIAVMVARAKLRFFPGNTLQLHAARFQQLLEEQCHSFGLGRQAPLFSRRAAVNLLATPEQLRMLEPWYHPDTWREMLLLRSLVAGEGGAVQELLKVVFSQIAKRCSSQRQHWGYVADNMVPKTRIYADAIASFKSVLEDAVGAFERFLALPELRGADPEELTRRSRVIAANLLEGPVVDESSVDLVVTSPPYPNVTDYTRAQRLSLWWFEKSVDDLREIEIGARYKRTRARAVTEYLEEMETCIQGIARSLRQGRFLCMVIGASKQQPGECRLIDNLCEMIFATGFVEVFEPIRRHRSRERLRRRDGVTSDEFILIFRKK